MSQLVYYTSYMYFRSLPAFSEPTIVRDEKRAIFSACDAHFGTAEMKVGMLGKTRAIFLATTCEMVDAQRTARKDWGMFGTHLYSLLDW